MFNQLVKYRLRNTRFIKSPKKKFKSILKARKYNYNKNFLNKRINSLEYKKTAIKIPKTQNNKIKILCLQKEIGPNKN